MRLAIKEKDYETIIEFQIKLAKETERIDLDYKIVSQGVLAVFNRPALGRYYVIEKDSKVIGSLLTVPEWSDWRNATALWIHSVYITEKKRNQGIFKEMYSSLKSMVEKSEEYCGLRLYVDKTNKNAQLVYKAIGMNDQHYSLFEWLK